MESYAETASALILSILISFGYTGAQSISLTHGSAQVGKPLVLTCSLIPSGSYSLFSVNWKLENYTNAIQRDATNCDSFFFPPEYEISRYIFSCGQSIFTMTINQLQQSDVHPCWICSVVFANGTQIAGTRCITLDDDSQKLLLLLLLLLLLVIPIFIILICCGCLDCCKCCRIFEHYDGKECCTVTCFCSKKGCCSFFYCTPGSKMGKCFCGHENKMGRCGGCHSCQKKCGCGWPDFCKSKKQRSCGRCYCSCCVEEITEKGLDDSNVPINRSPAIFPETKNNKVNPSTTKLPPITSAETVELKEPRKKKNKDKLDLGKSAEEVAAENTK